ncbi:MAG: hypothetical protein LBJ84_04035 [Oscillospiraceae bacterium]|jgi:hypothetical protein|nr:hypothetical protein [Oscillospiraceae bacterium]
MSEKVTPGPVCGNPAIKEAVCVHTSKIIDSCRAKDCVEDLRLYLTIESQSIVENSVNVRPRSASLLYVSTGVEDVPFNKGCYTVDIRYYYLVVGDAFSPACKPAEITGLAVFNKRVVLYGGESTARVFSSKTPLCGDCACEQSRVPTAVVEAVDPMVLGMKLVDICDCKYDPCAVTIPDCIAAMIPGDLNFGNSQRRVYVTLGQFSIAYLERDTQLLIPAYDYCMPSKESEPAGEDDPCTLFSKIHFPVDDFFPADLPDKNPCR